MAQTDAGLDLVAMLTSRTARNKEFEIAIALEGLPIGGVRWHEGDVITEAPRS